MKFSFYVKKEVPVDPKMAKIAQKGDTFVTGKGTNARVFVVAVSPVTGAKFLVEASSLTIVREVGSYATRATAKSDLSLAFGTGDYIAVEDIKNAEVSMTLTLK